MNIRKVNGIEAVDPGLYDPNSDGKEPHKKKCA
jgi:hypothetical protein